MSINRVLSFVLPLILIFGVISFLILSEKAVDEWQVEFEQAGTISSLRAVELTGDGILDLVIGAGGKEYEATEMGVLAINGNDGTLIWNVPSRNQIIGSAVFKDITGDTIADIFIGGRSSQLMAINGATGEVIWEYRKVTDSTDLVSDTTFLNFYNPQWIPDVNGNKTEDLLISFGGYVKAAADELHRPAGMLMILDPIDGEVLGRANMPDNHETYMSPVVHDFNDDGELEIVYGSGGETINGGLYLTYVKHVLSGDLTNSIKLRDGKGKGFIAPPVLVDITSDGVRDIVTNSMDGRTVAIDGNSYRTLWEFRAQEGLETYSAVAPVDMNGDGVLDFFASYGKGAWPDITGSLQVVIDGLTGRELFRDSIGLFQYGSPVAFDFTGDGHEDILYSVNKTSAPAFKGDLLEGQNNLYRFYTENIVFDLVNKQTYRIGKSQDGTNLGSTPLLIDLDQDGKLDIITCFMPDAFNFFGFDKLRIERKEVDRPGTNIKWGGYMGTQATGCY